jgi:hypothetical protein
MWFLAGKWRLALRKLGHHLMGFSWFEECGRQNGGPKRQASAGSERMIAVYIEIKGAALVWPGSGRGDIVDTGIHPKAAALEWNGNAIELRDNAATLGAFWSHFSRINSPSSGWKGTRMHCGKRKRLVEEFNNR